MGSPAGTMEEYAAPTALELEQAQLRESLVGRTIKELKFEGEILHIVLDNDTVFTPKLTQSSPKPVYMDGLT